MTCRNLDITSVAATRARGGHFCENGAPPHPTVTAPDIPAYPNPPGAYLAITLRRAPSIEFGSGRGKLSRHNLCSHTGHLTGSPGGHQPSGCTPTWQNVMRDHRIGPIQQSPSPCSVAEESAHIGKI
jgi:hypothetical protein